MELNTTKARLQSDPASLALVEALEESSKGLKLENAHVYFEFPLYKDDDNVVISRVLLVSPYHGLITFGTFNASEHDAYNHLKDTEESLDLVFGHLYSRLIKNKKLRSSKRDLAFPVDAAIYAPYMNNAPNDDNLETQVIWTNPQLSDFLNKIETNKIEQPILEEILSTIEGTKGLLRPKERTISGKDLDTKVAQVATLEAEINRFDIDQKHGFMGVLNGTQRIRGLAGSGKTVVLAMKVALTHLRHPDSRIAVTFHTKSLYQHVKRLITRFYRQYDDKDPDWSNVEILHGWGGKTNPGIYYNACIAHDTVPLTFGAAKSASSRDPFGYACEKLITSKTIEPLYDYVFVDEGQDFPAPFLQLTLALSKNQRLVIASDELQNIFQTAVPSMGELFGTNDKGEPLVTLEEDIVLHKCYRNPLEILLCAHALGFGLYSSQIVQLLENKQHWEDVGYTLEEGSLSEGENVKILRPEENSPSTISKSNNIDQIIDMRVHKEFEDEVEKTAACIAEDIQKDGLRPEDILVICADDRNAKDYFMDLTDALSKTNIKTNNLQIDTYGLRDFFEEGRVTLSTIYKAKGNEAYMVYLLGIDALFISPKVRARNMIFTAMTRAKAWICISGIGRSAEVFNSELNLAKNNCPYLQFTYPSERELKVMRRDLQAGQSHAIDRTLDELQSELPLEEFEKVLENRLRSLREKPSFRTKSRTKSRKQKK